MSQNASTSSVKGQMAGMWTRERATQLIKLYEKHELLWNNHIPAYRNKYKRKEALEDIAAEISTHLAGIGVDEVKNKINGIRTQYVNEVNKVKLAEAQNEPYEPSLWFYDKLTFLKNFTMPKSLRTATKAFSADWENFGNTCSTTQRTRNNKRQADYTVSQSTEQPAEEQSSDQSDSNENLKAAMLNIYPNNNPVIREELPDPDNIEPESSPQSPMPRSKEKANIIKDYLASKPASKKPINIKVQPKSNVKDENGSDDDIYIIVDEEFTIDQDGNRVNYDNKGNKTVIEASQSSTVSKVTPTNSRKRAASSTIDSVPSTSHETVRSSTPAPSNQVSLLKRSRRSYEDLSPVQSRSFSNRLDSSQDTRDFYDSTDVFGAFVTTQLRMIHNRNMRLKCQHIIQSCLIQWQQRQIEEDEKNADD